MALTRFQLDTLRVIGALQSSDSGPSGQEIKGELETYEHIGDVGHGRLYPNLDTLVDKGYVSKGTRDRRTNEYTLTDRGEDRIDRRREFWQ